MTLKLENVGKDVGKETHLADINLTLEPGSINVLLGPTLAGKTSLLRLMAGLDRPSSGRILADGVDVTRVDLRKRSVAMVYQQFINDPSFTVYDNIASPLRVGKACDKSEIDRRVRETAAMLGLETLLDRLPSELSGGQQQRTALARALVKKAKLLLLDEPLVNLDYKLREGLRTQMRDIFRRRQSIVVYATTEPEEALRLGGHTAVLDRGRILQFGATLDIYNNPANVRVGEISSNPPMNIFAAEVVGTAQGLEARLSDETRFPLTGHLARLAPGAYRFGVRAVDLGFAAAAPGTVPLEATVDLAEINGSETLVHARHGEIALVVQEQGVHAYGLGSRITLNLDPAKLFAFDGDGRLAASPFAMSAAAE